MVNSDESWIYAYDPDSKQQLTKSSRMNQNRPNSNAHEAH